SQQPLRTDGDDECAPDASQPRTGSRPGQGRDHLRPRELCLSGGRRERARRPLAPGSLPYPGAAENALNDLSFTVSPGETIAIVGRNGAGKTTLFKLICRLYDPSGGRILIDGVDIRDYDPPELRAQIGGMFQDYVPYQATAAE